MNAVWESTPAVVDEIRVSVYQPEQPGLIFPTVPTFTNVADERRHVKERLVAACCAFALQGFDYGFAGLQHEKIF